MRKKFLSFLLAVCMTLSLLPAQVLAAEVPGGETNLFGETAADASGEPSPEDTAQNQEAAGNDVPEEGDAGGDSAPEEPAAAEELRAGPYAYAETTSGSCGEDLTWSFDEASGTLTISGSGPMTDYSDEDENPAPWKGLPYTTIVFDGGITHIGSEAFWLNKNLTGVTIPETVTSIGSVAFQWCENLESIRIPGSVTRMGNGVFGACSALKTAVIEARVSSIGAAMFQGCSKLERVTLPQGLTSIGKDAFWECYELDMTIPETVTSIGEYAFYRCGLTELTIPDGVKIIPANAFNSCGKLTSLTIPDGVTEIGESAFTYCHSLTELTIPGSVKEISLGAFQNCYGLTSLTIREGVEIIGQSAFYDCKKLSKLSIPGSVRTIYDTSFNYTYDGQTTRPMRTAGPIGDGNTYDYAFGWTAHIPSNAFRNCGDLESVKLPEELRTIGDYAFSYCSKLASIEIPAGVTAIGEWAFQSCEKLNNVVLPEGLTVLNEGTFNNCTALTSITLPASLTRASERDAFWNCPGLTTAGPSDEPDNNYSIKFGWKTELPDYAFSCCTSLTSVTIPEGITSIGKQAFYDCSGLTGVTLPESLTSIGDQAFLRCSGLTGVTIPDAVASIAPNAFNLCDKLASITIPKSLTGVGAMFPNITSAGPVGSDCQLKFKWTEEIPGNAFSGCQQLTGVTIPDTVKSIGANAFQGCRLKSVKIPESVESIGAGAFQSCWDLTDITIPESIKTIESGTFKYCENLRDVTIPEGVESIGKEAFYSTALESVTIPGSVKSIGSEAFFGCEELTGVTILDGVESIGEYAFMDCGLNMVMIPDSVTSIERSAFDDDVTIVCHKGSCAEFYANKNGINCEILADSVFVRMATNVPNGVTTGTEFQLQASYMANEQEQADSLRIILPEGIAAGRVWLDGRPVENAVDGDGSVTVSSLPKDQAAHTLYVYCTATNAGSYSITGVLLTADAKGYPLGPAAVEAAQGRIEVPETVSHKTSILAFGKTTPGQAVKLFVDGLAVGADTANDVGSWKILFNLPEASESGSEHQVCARTSVGGSSVIIASETITYRASPVVQPTVVAMYNTGDRGAQETIFELADPGAVNLIRYYRMWPSRYPSFTFKAEFSREGALPSEVFIITVNSAKEERLIKAAYDENSGCWAGTSLYTDFRDAPMWVGVAYSDFDGNRFRSNLLSATAIMDPSGYVYEAVPSNRLEGVRAVISCERDGWSPWAAENFDQINPQTTGPDGGYYWDVPAGNWKVSFIKEGYRPAETGPLPVPPPQVGINVAMVSTAAPEVEYAAVYEDGAEITFSQYMDIGSVAGAISLNGKNAAVEALNAETGADGTTQYATRFRITAAGLSGSVTLAVSGARNYAGTAMAQPYSGLFQIGSRPTALAAVEKFIDMRAAENTEICARLDNWSDGWTILVENLTPDIIRTEAGSATTADGGRIAAQITALLPGTGILRLVEPVSGLEDTISIRVAPALDTTELAVQEAKIENGNLTYILTKTPWNAQLIIAGYQDGRMGKVVMTAAGKGGAVKLPDGPADSYVLFLVESGTMKPLCGSLRVPE